MTDFQIDADDLVQTSNQLVYLPTAEYRLIDLLGDTPINAIDINIYWTDQFGTYHQLILARNTQCSVKLLFRNKAFNEGSVALKE